jgi:hypothetical protein
MSFIQKGLVIDKNRAFFVYLQTLAIICFDIFRKTEALLLSMANGKRRNALWQKRRRKRKKSPWIE